MQTFHVHTYPDSNRICPSTSIQICSSTQDSSVTMVNRACAISHSSWRPTLATSRKRSHCVQWPYVLNIYAVKTRSEFVTSSDLKVSVFDCPHDSKFFVYSKLSNLESGFKKLWIRMPDSYGQANRQRKSCGFKNIRTRVDGA